MHKFYNKLKLLPIQNVSKKSEQLGKHRLIPQCALGVQKPLVGIVGCISTASSDSKLMQIVTLFMTRIALPSKHF